MREILFRGKPTASVLNEEDLQDCMFDIVDGFVYGNLIADEHEPTIVGKVVDSDWDYCSMEWWCPVVKETVGQFTGLLDKHGRKIFEGDVVRIEDFVNATVKWREDIACWTLQGYIIGNTWGSSMLEVIGNIYDNSDLMKEIIK